MSPAASTRQKGQRAQGALLLPLLLLLVPGEEEGSWAVPEAQQLHRVAGQTLSVRCQYPPKGWPYERKSWCKELSTFKCTRLVTSSGPRRLAQASRFSIWDNPNAGLFVVTMTGLKEEDSGHYWCRIYHASSNSVSKSIRFYLTVAPASASTQAPRASSAISTLSQGPQRRAATPTCALPLCLLFSRQQNCTLHSQPAAPDTLVPVLCGLLLAKSLMLLALVARWVLGSPHVQHRGRSLTRPAGSRPQASGPKKDGQWKMHWKTLLELRSPDAGKATCLFQQVIDLLWTHFFTSFLSSPSPQRLPAPPILHPSPPPSSAHKTSQGGNASLAHHLDLDVTPLESNGT
ncbi:natural cytotoxicity triggering receptor 2 [Hyaena hyaena]|uniref:natural cytotoxicity triggering receptor 2 n=1 Tax=Hyaena hyaena TaxID=95912 RepID=UPI001923C819|nr:natural cytotoxicity triggering receptor 2 [Hyaena hyaena]